MSSSRILSSRPSASCITAKPIARTIKGRGIPASPFFCCAEAGKAERAFPQSLPGAQCFMSLRPGDHTAHRWALWGSWVLSHHPAGSRESRAGFSVSTCRGHCFIALRPENRTAHCWGAVGAWVLPHRPTGSGKAEGFSARACRGHCFMALCPGNRTAHRWGTVGALALSHYSAGSRESRAGFSARVRRRHLLYGFPPRKSYSLLPGRSGAMNASASHSQEWNPCHKRKKRRKLPPLF